MFSTGLSRIEGHRGLVQHNFVHDQAAQTTALSRHEPHYLVFELGYTGHYPHYIRHLAQFWSERDYAGKLTFVVSPQFAQHHSDVLTVVKKVQSHRMSFEVLPIKEAARLTPRESSFKRARRSLQEWTLLRQYAQQLSATHCLLLYFDSFQAATLYRQPLPCPFSGIYFRPTLHYQYFSHYSPTLKERLQSWRERFILPLVLGHPQLQHLFCLDPYFVSFAHQTFGVTSPTYLPDPVESGAAHSNDDILKFKQQLGIDCERTTFLLFGALYDRRKGTEQVLDAIAQLPSAACQKLCLLLVGQLGDHQEATLRNQINQLTQNQPVQIVVKDGFVPDSEVLLCFQATDVVLAPYQRHVGMSGILVHAAAAQKPLIASNYGLLGEVVRQFRLGVTVDSSLPAELASALQECLEGNLDKMGDRQQMSVFAQQNSAESFAELIFKMLQKSTKISTGA